MVVNDVSGGLADPRILHVVAERGAAYVVMHWRAHSTEMQQHASYDDVLVEVRDELAQRLEAAVAAGIAEDRLVVDPGLGFAKTADHNWELLQRLPELGDARRADPGRVEPQVVPRHPARRPGRQPAPGRWTARTPTWR